MRDRYSATLRGRRSGRREFAYRPVHIVLAAVILAVTVTASSGWRDPAIAAPPHRTVAVLGDSYSSGEGSPPFDTLDPRCRRSSHAWARQLSTLDSSLSVSLFAACAGATTDALNMSFKGEKPQLTQLRQMKPAPDIVTITIGGNDAGFSNVIVSCFAWKCFWDGKDKRERDVVNKELPDLLTSNYEAVKAAVPHARVLVVGYPTIFPSSQSKNTCTWLNSTERRQVSSLNSLLDRVIRRAADKADVEYVPTDRALRGHEMCTRDPWVAPVGLFSPARDLSAHPTALGQAAIAKAVDTYLTTHDAR
jgi:lysophospholipase L1-like esterase